MIVIKQSPTQQFAQMILPRNIGIIMDGNGRWAKKRGLPRSAGHAQGARVFRKIIRYCNKIGIEYVTVYAFSTENWKRSDAEVKGIMKLLRDYLSDAENYKKENVKTRFIGDRSILDQDIIDKMHYLEDISKDATGLTLNIAVNYGGQNELVNAFRQMASRVQAGELKPENITEQTVEDHLYTAGQPPVDLILRPSGEYRLSNFLIWQCAYAEYIFMDVLWPDFNEKHLSKALEEYSKRNRRFGAE